MLFIYYAQLATVYGLIEMWYIIVRTPEMRLLTEPTSAHEHSESDKIQ